jgi:hypothetical protein
MHQFLNARPFRTISHNNQVRISGNPRHGLHQGRMILFKGQPSHNQNDLSSFRNSPLSPQRGRRLGLSRRSSPLRIYGIVNHANAPALDPLPY